MAPVYTQKDDKQIQYIYKKDCFKICLNMFLANVRKRKKNNKNYTPDFEIWCENFNSDNFLSKVKI